MLSEQHLRLSPFAGVLQRCSVSIGTDAELAIAPAAVGHFAPFG
jgi:hypothetical protein